MKITLFLASLASLAMAQNNNPGIYLFSTVPGIPQYYNPVSTPHSFMYSDAVNSFYTNLNGFATVVLNNQIYGFGGATKPGFVSASFVFGLGGVNIMAPNTNLAKLKNDRFYPALGTYKGKIVACGGLQYNQDGQSDLPLVQSCEIYNPSADSWTSLAAPADLYRQYASMVELDSGLYQIGGSVPGTSDGRTRLFRYDGSSWTALADLPLLNNKTLQMTAAIKVDGNTFMVCGGKAFYSYIHNCFTYSASSNTWANAAPLNVGRQQFTLANYQGRIYALGGAQTNSLAATVEYLVPGGANWSNFPVPLANGFDNTGGVLGA